MAVPEEIRRVKRPRNTVVVDRGGNGPKRWAVVERVGCRRVGGRNLPVDGKTVGHIIQGRYVPKERPAGGNGGGKKLPVASMAPEVRWSWGAVAMIQRAWDSTGLLDQLLSVFDAGDAVNILAVACLRVVRPGIADRDLADAYERSWLSVALPGAQLSKNKVSQLQAAIGLAHSLVVEFMRMRVSHVAKGHHIAIDGTLKQDNSKVNDFSKLSRKTRVRGTRDISIIYAFDVEGGEPVCAKVYPGNVVDEVAYEDFLLEFGIREGLIIGDKAFRQSSAKRAFKGRKGLHWLNPLKRNDARIKRHGMYDWEGVLEGAERDVKYKKSEVRGGKWLYSFYDRKRAAKEEADWFRRQSGKAYDKEKAEVAAQRFGTVVFESDLDMDPLAVWRTYEERWEIELAFRYYKQALDLDDTRVQGNESVVGSEFVNFVATALTMELVKEFDKAHLLEKETYGRVMDDLRGAARVMGDDGEWVLARGTKRAEKTMRALKLIVDDDPEDPEGDKVDVGDRPQGGSEEPAA